MAVCVSQLLLTWDGELPWEDLVSVTSSPRVPGTEWTIVDGMEVSWVVVTITSSDLSSCSSLDLSKECQANSLFSVSLKPAGLSRLPVGWVMWRRRCVLLSYLQSWGFSRVSFLSLDWGTRGSEWGGLFSQLLIHLKARPTSVSEKMVLVGIEGERRVGFD